MKVELAATERAYVANLLRRRVLEAQTNAEAAQPSSAQAEWLSEAEMAESLAIRFDDGGELAVEGAPNRPAPKRVDRTRDIDNVDAPVKPAPPLPTT